MSQQTGQLKNRISMSQGHHNIHNACQCFQLATISHTPNVHNTQNLSSLQGKICTLKVETT